MIGVQGWTGLKAGWWKVDCPVSTTTTTNPTTTTMVVSFTDFQASLANAISNYYSGSGKLTENELKDLLAAYPSTPVSSVGLTGIGSLSGAKLIDIYNKAK